VKQPKKPQRRTIKRYHTVWEVAKELWKRIEHLLPPTRPAGTPGRPPLSNRQAYDGVAHVFRTGCQWKSLKTEWFGAASSIHERFQSWVARGIWDKVFKKMLELYDKLRHIQWRWQALDSKSVPAPLGGALTGKNPTDRGKLGSKWHMLVDQRGAPLAITISAANTHDKCCALATLKACPVRTPRRMYRYRIHHLCADKGYDYTDIRQGIDKRGYRVHIAHRGDVPKPIKRHRRHPARRWVVERTHSWHNNFRSLRVRWAKKPANWLALIHLAAALTLCRLAVYL
jgi:putative transposase